MENVIYFRKIHTFALSASAYLRIISAHKTNLWIFRQTENLFIFIGRDREKCSYFASERRFGKTDAMVWNTGIYRMSDHLLSSRKQKNRNAIRRWAVRRFQPRSLPCCTLQQGDKRHPVCCFHRWQAVRWYCEAVKTKHLYSFCVFLFFRFFEKFNRGCFHLYFLCVKQVGFCAILRQ